MYRHAWESILAFSHIQDLSRAMRVSRATFDAVKHMKPAELDIRCNLEKLQCMQQQQQQQQSSTFIAMARHIGRATLVDIHVHNAMTIASQLGIVITEIYMCHADVYSNNTSSLTRILRTNTTIRKVSLDDCLLDEGHLRRLIDSLKSNHSVVELHLKSCRLYDQGLIQLADLIKSNKFIHTLSLEDDDLTTYVSISSLAEALEANSTLTSISFQNIGLYDLYNRSMLALASMLRVNTTITSLRLNKCWITNVDCLFDALKINQTLQFIHLDSNRINPVRTLVLIDIVASHPSITHLSLQHNLVSHEDAVAMTKHFHLDRSHKEIYL